MQGLAANQIALQISTGDAGFDTRTLSFRFAKLRIWDTQLKCIKVQARVPGLQVLPSPRITPSALRHSQTQTQTSRHRHGHTDTQTHTHTDTHLKGFTGTAQPHPNLEP